MKSVITSLLIATNAFALNIPKLVESIGQIESGMDHQAVGDGGQARGAWQMHRAAWADAGKRLGTSFHFSYAHDKGIGHRYATAYAEIIIEQLKHKLKREPTPQEVYAAWRLGVTGLLRRGGYQGCPAYIKESCDRLYTLYSR